MNLTYSSFLCFQVDLLCHRDLLATKTALPAVNDPSRFLLMSALGPDEKYAESFCITKPIGFSAPSIGVLQVKWSTTMGEHGFIRGDDINSPVPQTPVPSIAPGQASSSNLLLAPTVNKTPLAKHSPSSPDLLAATASDQKSVVTVHVLDCPSALSTGQEFDVKIRLYNNGAAPLNLILKCSNPCRSTDGSVGLLYVGATTVHMGILLPKQVIDASVKAIALNSGLQDIGGITVVDAVSKKELSSSASVAKFLVYDSYPEVSSDTSIAINT